jgi:hypothetical protein
MKTINTAGRNSERGSATVKFVIVIAIIAIVAYAGYQFIPVAYQAYQIKDLMQHDVDTAVAIGHPAAWVKDQLVKSSAEYGIPADAVITPTLADNRMEVRVQYTLPVEFPGYVYTYEFDHTAKSATFLTIK